MLIIRKVIRIIRKIVKSHQNIENQKFIKSAFKIRNALNEKLDDQEILDDMIGYSEDIAQDAIQKNIRYKTFVMTEFTKYKLERYYKKLKQIIPDIYLSYDFICINTMINQESYKEIASILYNNKYYPNKLELFNKIRNYFNDKYII